MGSDTDYPVMSEAGKTLENSASLLRSSVRLSGASAPARTHELRRHSRRSGSQGSDRRRWRRGAPCGGHRCEYDPTGDRGAHGHQFFETVSSPSCDGSKCPPEFRLRPWQSTRLEPSMPQFLRPKSGYIRSGNCPEARAAQRRFGAVGGREERPAEAADGCQGMS